ncbi:MAG: DUF447 domain-containing protein [Methanomicrobiales archaeon HGW-Methanomicrobiales-3]|jgi:hypothetical protein|nr:MAG: DUF447 domain-containing protein [Methanomicrobiales archaeon HGW-Methanomicrobiales-3]
MGLLRSGINEVIATTACNAAPIGIHLRDGCATMILFSGSHTAENVERDGWVVANFIHDPVLYVKTAFEDLPKTMFVDEPVDGVTMTRLRAAEAWVAFSADIEKKTSGAMMVRLTPKKEVIEEVRVHPVNRGFGSIIDATVHATRLTIQKDPRLRETIEYHAGIIRKCGGMRELEALELLMKYC